MRRWVDVIGFVRFQTFQNIRRQLTQNVFPALLGKPAANFVEVTLQQFGGLVRNGWGVGLNGGLPDSTFTCGFHIQPSS